MATFTDQEALDLGAQAGSNPEALRLLSELLSASTIKSSDAYTNAPNPAPDGDLERIPTAPAYGSKVANGIQGTHIEKRAGKVVASNDPTNPVDPLISFLQNLAADDNSGEVAVGMPDFSSKLSPQTDIPAANESGKDNKNTNIALLSSQDFLKSVDTQIATIEKIEDPLQRQKAYMEFEANMASNRATILKDHTERASREFGVPMLTEQLKQSIALDKAHPDPEIRMLGSSETESIRNMLEDATMKSQASVGKTLSTDAMLAVAEAKAQIFGKTQARIIDNALSRDSRAEDIADDVLIQYNENATTWTSAIVDPEIAGDPKKLKLATAALINKNNEAKQAFNSNVTKEQLPMLAMAGNSVAGRIASKLHSTATGESIEKVQKDLRVFAKAAESEDNFAVFLSEPKNKALFDSAELNAYTAEQITRKKDATSVAEGTAARVRLLSKAQTIQAQRRLEGDITNWVTPDGKPNLMSDPEIADSIAKLKAAKGDNPISIRMLTDEYIGSAPRELRAARKDKLKMYYENSIDQHNKGLYGHVRKEDLLIRLRANIFGEGDGTSPFASGILWR